MKDFWEKDHKIYAEKGWVNNTTIFSQFAVGYFPKQGKLLDLGAGQGQDSRYFAKMGYNVTSTDISDFALNLSNEKAKKEGLHIRYLEMDTANEFPFEDNSFDIVYSHLSLHYFTDKKTKEVFEEISRVLKPQGILACLLNTIDDPQTIDPNYELLEKDYYRSPAGLLKKYFSVEYLQEVTDNLFVPIILDNNGESFRDDIKTLIRFIGKTKK